MLRSAWTKPWSAIVPLSSVQGPLWEYACSESNNDAIQIMVDARNAEKAASEKPKTPAGIPSPKPNKLDVPESL
jgi:hypothetical protein